MTTTDLRERLAALADSWDKLADDRTADHDDLLAAGETKLAGVARGRARQLADDAAAIRRLL